MTHQQGGSSFVNDEILFDRIIKELSSCNLQREQPGVNLVVTHQQGGSTFVNKETLSDRN